MKTINQVEILDKIKQEIVKSSFSNLVKSLKEWERANVIVTSSSRPIYTSKTVIRSRHALVLSWLFIQLRDQTILLELIEEDEFYGKLALAAKNYLFREADNENPQGLLLAVLEKAERMLDEYQVEVFVYGTLMTGGSNHQLLKSAEFLGEDAIDDAELVYLGTHPMLVPGEGVVYGERYRVSLKTVEVLDRLEGHPHYYRRRWAYLKSGQKAVVYEGNEARTKGQPRIESGQWLSASTSNQSQTNLEETFVTSSTYEFLSSLRSLDIKLFVDGEKLRCNAPQGVLTPTLQREIVERKAEILAFLSKASTAASSHVPPILSVSRQVNLHLSFAQERVWFLEQLKSGSSVYNLPLVFRLEGRLNVTVLERSLGEIARRHEILRTTFVAVDGQPSQVIVPDIALTLPVIDLWELPPAQQETEVQRHVTEDAQQPFNLAKGPLWRVKILRLAEAEYVLQITMHHIVSDAWSFFNVFSRELTSLYEAFSIGNCLSSLPELPIQYADFACWQRQWLQGEVLESQLDYWKQQFSGSVPALQLPIDRLQPSVHSYQGARQSLKLPQNLTLALNSLSQREGVTLFMTLLTAFKMLLCRYTGQEDIILCTPVAGRSQVETEALIGYFSNILPIRTYFGGNPNFLELLDRVRRGVLGAYEHQDVPLQKLADLPNLVRTSLSRGMFVLLSTPNQPLELSGITVSSLYSSLQVSNGTANFDLSLYMEERGETLVGVLEYKTDLFDAATISQMLENFQTLLEDIVVDPEQHLEELPSFTQSHQGFDKNGYQAQIGQEQSVRFVAPRNELELQLTVIWEKVLAIQPIGVRDNFFELGGSSLLAVRLFAQIEKTFGENFPIATLFQAATVEQMANVLQQEKEERSESWSSLVAIQLGSSKPPFFCVPADSGNILCYRGLAHLLGSEQPVYGLLPQGLDGKQPLLTQIEDLAAYYIKVIRTSQPEGPYFLGGFCFGGLVAFEMAQQLQSQGQKVALLALIDTAAAVKSTISLHQNFHRHLKKFLRLGPKEKLLYILQKARARLEVITRPIVTKLKLIAYKFYLDNGRSLPLFPLYIPVQEVLNVSNYVPQVYSGSVTLFRAAGGVVELHRDPQLGWDELAAGGLELHDIPGGHGILEEPYVRVLAETLKACLDKTQAEEGLSSQAKRNESVRLAGCKSNN